MKTAHNYHYLVVNFINKSINVYLMDKLILALNNEEECRLKNPDRLFDNGYCDILIYSRIIGIESLSPSRVLEIGPRLNGESFKKCFPNAQYEAVGFEVAQDHVKAEFHGNFMSLERPPYNLIISSGVFEEAALDRENSFPLPSDRFCASGNNYVRLQKLYELTSPSGVHVIGTTTTPCIFSNREIEDAGFSIDFRTNYFYGSEIDSRTRRLVKGDSNSELVVFRKE